MQRGVIEETVICPLPGQEADITDGVPILVGDVHCALAFVLNIEITKNHDSNNFNVKLIIKCIVLKVKL